MSQFYFSTLDRISEGICSAYKQIVDLLQERMIWNHIPVYSVRCFKKTNSVYCASSRFCSAYGQRKGVSVHEVRTCVRKRTSTKQTESLNTRYFSWHVVKAFHWHAVLVKDTPTGSVSVNQTGLLWFPVKKEEFRVPELWKRWKIQCYTINCVIAKLWWL